MVKILAWFFFYIPTISLHVINQYIICQSLFLILLIKFYWDFFLFYLVWETSKLVVKNNFIKYSCSQGPFLETVKELRGL